MKINQWRINQSQIPPILQTKRRAGRTRSSPSAAVTCRTIPALHTCFRFSSFNFYFLMEASHGDLFQARATCLGWWYFNTSEWSWCCNYLQTSFCSSKFIFIMHVKVIILKYDKYTDPVLLLALPYVLLSFPFWSLKNVLPFLFLLIKAYLSTCHMIVKFVTWTKIHCSNTNYIC
jgi:hypothetical protein